MRQIILLFISCFSSIFMVAQSSQSTGAVTTEEGEAVYASQVMPSVYTKKMVLQAFWWDYTNNNYSSGWANYLADLAPRMRQMGVDAVWIPPTSKNEGGANGVGYAPFDHYDLGDKFQKNSTKTRMGTKDELLRMVAVLHANGIEVIQDIVPNHVIGAGSDTGGGGQDPAAPVVTCTDPWKNFRYACYATPATNQSATEYLARVGRFPKNHHNFHPNGHHACSNGVCDPNADAWCWQGFGPDVCYFDNAAGLSSNATYNPNQSTYSPNNNGGTGVGNGYMRKHYREWLIWSKKQMGFDGVRIDAVKHFPEYASEDFLYNLQQTSGWANGTDRMFAVGEWVGSTSALDGWTTAVQNRSGTFDFNLRAFAASGSLYSMIYGNGSSDMGAIPGTQQNLRYIDIGTDRIHRTVPFVNNHDTYRPQKDPLTGNITGWNTGDELSPHVDIREPRIGAAYAVACAVDGNPQIFFEDLFNIANTGKRFSHLPTSVTDLPQNSDIANIMQAHGALNFKSGDYKVPSNVASFYNTVTMSNNNDDLLAIERSGKAIILATDNWNVAQNAWMDTDFPVGTVLVDYSGGYATTSTVLGPDPSCTGVCPNRVNLSCRPVGYPSFTYSTTYSDHGAQYHGYAIWAPQGQNIASYINPSRTTTQEWEMEQDLGDSHCQSLGQGGRTPNMLPNARVIGKIFAEANTTVSYEVTLGTPAESLTFEWYDRSGNRVHQQISTASPMTGNFTNTSKRWLVMKIRNSTPTSIGQKCFVKVTYQGPAVANAINSPAANTVSVWTSNGGSTTWNDCKNWEEGRIPNCVGDTVIIPHAVAFMPVVDPCFTGSLIDRTGLTLAAKVMLQGAYLASAGLMRDDLRSLLYLPTTSPYGDGATCLPSVLEVTGNNAVVDWVKVELRDKNAPGTVLFSRSGLLQRDGDIVGMDGIAPLKFTGVAADNYFIAIRHRNHLGVMSATAIPMSFAGTTIDFTQVGTPTFGTNAQKNISGVMALQSGNANNDGQISYNGTANDRVKILVKVGFATPNNIVTGYHDEDVTMDGEVRYNGTANDRVHILVNVGFSTPNNIITQTLP